MPITSQLVKDFYAEALKHYGAKVVSKDDSEFMRLIGGFLNAIGVLDKEEFMKVYTTTIGETIYAPYEVGVDGGAEGYTLWEQVKVLVHELVHAEQYHDHPAEFTLKYLLYKSDRASYEAEAFGADLEMHWWRYGKAYDLKQRASLLQHYGLQPVHVDYVANYLEILNDVLRQGGSVSPVAAWAKVWLDQHGAKP